MTKFFIKHINKDTILPKNEFVSSVFLFAFDGTKILSIKNDRGWGIPGGHVEKGETPKEALIREVEEEAGASFSNEKLFAFVESDEEKYKNKVMFMYTTRNFKLGKFTQSEDAFDREVIETEEFFKRYGDNFNLKELINYGKNLV